MNIFTLSWSNMRRAWDWNFPDAEYNRTGWHNTTFNYPFQISDKYLVQQTWGLTINSSRFVILIEWDLNCPKKFSTIMPLQLTPRIINLLQLPRELMVDRILFVESVREERGLHSKYFQKVNVYSHKMLIKKWTSSLIVYCICDKNRNKSENQVEESQGGR